MPRIFECYFTCAIKYRRDGDQPFRLEHIHNAGLRLARVGRLILKANNRRVAGESAGCQLAYRSFDRWRSCGVRANRCRSVAHRTSDPSSMS